MADTTAIMAKKKPKGGKRYPSRDNVKYAGIPRDYWDLLDGMAREPGGKYEGRSVSFLVKIAVRALLQHEGKIDPNRRPPGGGQ